MQSLSNKSKSSALFSTGTAGLGINATPLASASHISDVIQGSNWSTAYGAAGYILPNTASGSILNSTFISLPSWFEIISTTITSSADTFSSNRPNKPDNSGTNDFWMIITGSPRTLDFNISENVGNKKISFYITQISTGSPSDQVGIALTNLSSNVLLTSTRVYNNSPSGSGISTVGGLIAQYEVSGAIRLTLYATSFFGNISAIFFDD